MDATEAARRSAEAIQMLPAGFMMDGATYERGAQLGFEGVDFYVAGRGGALGDVHGKVVAAAFVYFNPTYVCEAWDRSGKISSRLDAAVEFRNCLSTWAEGHLADGIDYERLAELSKYVIDETSPAELPLFAAWSEIHEPPGSKPLALHRLNVLREMRGGMHGAAVFASGLAPREALMVNSPYMAAVFGWSEPHPDPEPHREAWQEAEATTDRIMGRALSVLSSDQRVEFVELACAAFADRT